MFRSPFPARPWFIIAGALLINSGVAHATTYTVGDDAACTHANVQAAINAATGAGPHHLRIKTMLFTAQTINVAGKDITLTGGYATCAAATPTGVSTLSGAGGANTSVFGITGAGNDVILENLAIIRGDEVSNGTGGGIDFRGDGFLTLRKTAVTQNYAGYGAGINVAPGGTAELRIEAGTVIQFNTAQYSGGGIRLEGHARLVMVEDQTLVQGNEALGTDPSSGDATYGYGGGVEVIAPAVADIGSPGYGPSAVITGNTARYGGGISLNGIESDGAKATVRLFTTDPSRPVRLEGNRALQEGGGVYLVPYRDFNDVSDVTLCAQDFRIDGNFASQGSAIHSSTDYDGIAATRGGAVYFGNYACGGVPLGTLGAVACADDVECNTVNDNVAENASHQPTLGSTIFLHDHSQFHANHFEMRRNTAAQLIRALGDFTSADLADCLIVQNTTTSHLIRMEGGGDGNTFSMSTCTIAYNPIGAAHVFSMSHDFTLRRSIIDQNGTSSLTQGGGTRTTSDVIANDTVSLGGGSVPTLLAATPRFIDPAHGDFHLQAASAAVDFSLIVGGADLDLGGRSVDHAIIPNRFGAGDLGAYERQTVGNLMLNRGFEEDLRLWDVVTPGVSTWNASGANSTGAVRISKTPYAQGNLVGLSQCVHIPGPGSYRLTGLAYGLGSAFERDKVFLGWKLRANTGGESCVGAITSQGTVTFPGNASWSAPTTPGQIDVSAAQWTRFSAVEVSLIVLENGLSINETTTGYFDGIVLEPIDVGSDRIFANGFQP